MLTVTLDTRTVEEAEAVLRAFPAILREWLRRAMLAATGAIQRIAKTLVPTRTRRLQGAIVLKPVETGPDGIGATGGVGPGDVPYAAAIEFGKHKPETVHEYVRRTRSRTQFEATPSGRARVYRGKKVGVQTGSVTVREHTRIPDRYGRWSGTPYFRPALSQALKSIGEIHTNAARKAFEEMQARRGF